MPNKNQPIGLRPEGDLIRATKYIAGSTVYPGDPVILATDGQVDSSVTTPLIGVALNYATVNQNVMVADHPDQRFIVQANSSVAQSDINGNFDLTLGTPSTTYKRSATVMNVATSDKTTATNAVKLLAIADEIDNAAGSTNVDVIVKINNHQQNGGTGTAGLA